MLLLALEVREALVQHLLFLGHQLIMLAVVAVQDTTRVAQPHLAVVMEALTVVVLELLGKATTVAEAMLISVLLTQIAKLLVEEEGQALQEEMAEALMTVLDKAELVELEQIPIPRGPLRHLVDLEEDTLVAEEEHIMV